MREWCASRWESPIGATEYPVELMRKPTGPPHFECGQGRTAHGAHPFVLVRGHQPFQPVDSSSPLIVEARENIPICEAGRSVASGAKMTVVLICHNYQRHRSGWTLSLKVFCALLQQLVIMIDAYDDLDRR